MTLHRRPLAGRRRPRRPQCTVRARPKRQHEGRPRGSLPTRPSIPIASLRGDRRRRSRDAALRAGMRPEKIAGPANAMWRVEMIRHRRPLAGRSDTAASVHRRVRGRRVGVSADARIAPTRPSMPLRVAQGRLAGRSDTARARARPTTRPARSTTTPSPIAIDTPVAAEMFTWCVTMTSVPGPRQRFARSSTSRVRAGSVGAVAEERVRAASRSRRGRTRAARCRRSGTSGTTAPPRSRMPREAQRRAEGARLRPPAGREVALRRAVAEPERGGSPMPGSVAAWRRKSVCPPRARASRTSMSSARASGAANARKRTSSRRGGAGGESRHGAVDIHRARIARSAGPGAPGVDDGAARPAGTPSTAASARL